jgi:regulator of nonsense transcripts 2
MKSQQAAEREEQQRIKNLVLNYDLQDDQHDGTFDHSLFGPIHQPALERNPNTKGLKLGSDHYNPSLSRAERSGRHAPRARRLNLSDVDWYGEKSASKSPSSTEPPKEENEKPPEVPRSPSKAVTVPRRYKKPG